MAKSIKDILSELEKTRQDKKETLKEKEKNYYEHKEHLRQDYLKLLWDMDLNRPLNPWAISKQPTGGNKKPSNGQFFIGNFALIENITPIGDLDGLNKTFILPQFPVPGSEHIVLNGLLQDDGLDYIINGNIIEFILAPNYGEIIQVTYLISL